MTDNIYASDVAAKLSEISDYFQEFVDRLAEVKNNDLSEDDSNEKYLKYLKDDIKLTEITTKINEDIISMATFFKDIKSVEERFDLLSNMYFGLMEDAPGENSHIPETLEDLGFNIKDANEEYLNQLQTYMESEYGRLNTPVEDDGVEVGDPEDDEQ